MTNSVFAGIGINQGKVVVQFSHKHDTLDPAQIDTWIMDPNECLDISEAMAQASFEAGTGFKPLGDTLKSEIIEKHRMILTQRISTMLNSTREDKRISNGKLAKSFVDTVLKEIF